MIEDDYDSEFRFSGRPLETLQAMDRNGRVIYVGSFSKTMLPALRLGFLIAPASLHAALNAVSYVTQWHCQWPAQAALARFIEEGLLARHIRKMRREYTARHERIADRLACDFAEWLEVVPSVAGMHLCATLRRSSRRFERDVADRARQAGLGLHRLSTFTPATRRGRGSCWDTARFPCRALTRDCGACGAASSLPRRPRPADVSELPIADVTAQPGKDPRYREIGRRRDPQRRKVRDERAQTEM